MEQENRVDFNPVHGQSKRPVLGSLEAGLPEEFSGRKRISWKSLGKDFKRENDDKKLQEMLNNTPMTAIRGYIQRYKAKQSPVFLDFLTSALEDKGFSVKRGDVHAMSDAINAAGIPIKREDTGHKARTDKREYPIILSVVIAKDIGRIIKVLKAKPELFAQLNNNPVKLAYGPMPDSFPTRGQLRKRQEYMGIRSIVLKYFGIAVHGAKYPDLLSGSPVSIFSIAAKGKHCSLADLDIFLPFLEKRLRESGRIK